MKISGLSPFLFCSIFLYEFHTFLEPLSHSFMQRSLEKLREIEVFLLFFIIINEALCTVLFTEVDRALSLINSNKFIDFKT